MHTLEQAIALVTDGRDVDWPASIAAAENEVERNALRHLQTLTETFTTGTAVATSQAGETHDGRLSLGTWGHLALVAELGRGVHGVVYRAWDTHLKREVALKLLHHASPDAMLHEARRLARVSHPSMVAIHGVDQNDGRMGLWMELLQGLSLDAILARQGPFSASEAVGIGLDVCSAVAAIHAAGLVHRDIKAQNVVREPGGRIVLMDLGASDLLAPEDTQVRSLAGTPLYMAPELFSGASATVRSDVYAIGVLLYRLATAAYPIDGQTLGDIRRAHENHELVPLRDARPDLPTSFVMAVEQCLARDPLHRYASVAHLERSLARITGTTRRPSPFQRIAAAGLVILAAGLGSAGTWMLLTSWPNSVARERTPALAPDQYALFAGYEELAYERLEQQPAASANALRSAMALMRPALPGHSGEFALLYIRLAEAERRAGRLDRARSALWDANAHAASVLGETDPIRSLLALETARGFAAAGDTRGAERALDQAAATRRAGLGLPESPIEIGDHRSQGEDVGTALGLPASAFLALAAHGNHEPSSLGWQSHARFPARGIAMGTGDAAAWRVEALESMAFHYQRLPPALTARALTRGFSLFARVRPENGLATLALDCAPGGRRFDVFVRRLSADRIEVRAATGIVPRVGPELDGLSQEGPAPDACDSQ